MVRLRHSPPAVPYALTAKLRRAGRRTTLVRLGLAAALIATAALELGFARGGGINETSYLQPGSTNVVVMDFSYSITGSAYRLIVNGLRKIAATQSPVALVGFSDVAYEMLPPGTPARELDPVARRFIPVPNKSAVEFPPSPWAPLEGGTRISGGLDLADEILRRDHIRRASVFLISDLETSTDDDAAISDAVDSLKQHGYSLHLIPLEPSDTALHFFEGLVGGGSFIRSHDLDRPIRTSSSTGLLSGSTPWHFLLAACLLACLLGVNERTLAPLTLAGLRRR
jgi:hypothetical protein